MTCISTKEFNPTPSKPRNNPLRCKICNGKVRTRPNAKQYPNQMERRGYRLKKYPYRCGYCGKYRSREQVSKLDP